MGFITMSADELTRLRVIQDLIATRITPRHATELLGLTARQVRRLRRRFCELGPGGLVSLHRGRPSNRRIPLDFKQNVVALLRTHYADFGPTFASQKLQERHRISLSAETVRSWMKEEGLWVDRRTRRKPVHQPRHRRECYGELVQIDGSEHWWFEDRGPQCTLLVYIDDATSRLMQLKFVQSESAFSYFAATAEYLERHGKPIAFYSDKHSVFRVTRKSALVGDGMTQFGRALHDLNIDIICANTPQAKGRVERANRTLQDRLVKEMRLRDISTIEEANKFLPEFMGDYNQRFAKDAANPKDLHRPLRPEENIRDVFAWREERTVSGSLTLQYDNMVFLLEPNEFTRELVRKRVIVCDYPDGRLIITHNGRPLSYSRFDKVRQITQGAIVDNKRLGATLAIIKQGQEQNGAHRSQHGPRRLDQSHSIFSRPSEPVSALRKKRHARKAAVKKATSNVAFLSSTEHDTTPKKRVVDRSSRLPVDFDPSNPIASPDTFWERELLLMERRNLNADRERMLLNRRRYASQRKHLKALEAQKHQDKLAA